MQIFQDTIFEVGTRVWSIEPPKPSMMVAVKATFDLIHGGLAALATEQEPLTEGLYHDDDPAETVRYASDYAFVKPQAELLLMGHAHAPGGRPVERLEAEVSVGELTKRFVVFGDRFWRLIDGDIAATPPQPFDAIPLRWEHAFGGPAVEANPVGAGLTALDGGEIPLPNIEDPGDLIVEPRSYPRPAGAFPIPSTWPERAALLGTCDEQWRKRRFPFPAEDFDPAYFNAAPRDLRLARAFPEDVPIALRNLAAGTPELVTRLPGLRPRAFVEWEPERGWGLNEVALLLDTITLDTDTARAICLWRGLVRLPGTKLEPNGVARLLVLDEPASRRSTPEECRDRVTSRGRRAVTSGAELEEAQDQSQELWVSVDIDVGALDQTGYEPSVLLEPWSTGEVSAVQIQTGEIPAFSKLSFAVTPDAVEGARRDPSLAGRLSALAEPPVIEEPKEPPRLEPIATPSEPEDGRDQPWLTPIVPPVRPIPPTQVTPAVTPEVLRRDGDSEPTTAVPAITPEMLGKGLTPAKTELFRPEEVEPEATVMLDLEEEDAEETTLLPPLEEEEPEPTVMLELERAEARAPSQEIPSVSVEVAEEWRSLEVLVEEEERAALAGEEGVAPEAPEAEVVEEEAKERAPAILPIECRIKNLTPFVVGTKLTAVEPPRPSLTVVVRGRFDLVPDGLAALSRDDAERDGLAAGAWAKGLLADDDGLGEVLSPDDMADFKVRADILLRGSCYTPDGRPMPRCPVGFQVGTWRKALWVVGQRTWREGFFGAKASEPMPFRQMSLSYSHSFGGPGFPFNPVGRGLGTVTLPNIESPNEPIRTPRDRPAPAGFGPINAEWFPRFSKRSRKSGATWLKTRAPAFPPDFDWTFFNEAPEDQQLQGYLKGDEWLRLQNLHRTHPVLETRLPGLRIRCFVDDREERLREVSMNLDTLVVDTDAGQVLLTWRGVTPVSDCELEDVTALLIDSEPLSENPKDLDHYQGVLERVEASPVNLDGFLPVEELALFEAKRRGDGQASSAALTTVVTRDVGDRSEARSIVRPSLEVVKDTPFEADWFAWKTRSGQSCLTAVVKGTFDLAESGRCFIAPDQAPIAGDVHREGEPERDLRFESDLANLKLRGECLVVGSCYAPGGLPVPSTLAACKIGPLAKVMAIFGDRRLDRSGDTMGEPAPFTVMPLGWDRAFGGPGSRLNPLGRGLEGDALPNIEDPNDLIRDVRSRPKPLGAFPIPRTWPARSALTGLADESALAATWPRLPDGFDLAYFNAAPPDQRIDGFFRGDEEITLVNLHPKLPKLRCRLPGLAVMVFLKQAGREALRPLTTELDTITVDTDTGKVFCLWRAVTELPPASIRDLTHLFVAHRRLDGHARPETLWP